MSLSKAPTDQPQTHGNVLQDGGVLLSVPGLRDAQVPIFHVRMRRDWFYQMLASPAPRRRQVRSQKRPPLFSPIQIIIDPLLTLATNSNSLTQKITKTLNDKNPVYNNVAGSQLQNDFGLGDEHIARCGQNGGGC